MGKFTILSIAGSESVHLFLLLFFFLCRSVKIRVRIIIVLGKLPLPWIRMEPRQCVHYYSWGLWQLCRYGRWDRVLFQWIRRRRRKGPAKSSEECVWGRYTYINSVQSNLS
jgi:hypothetical protein